MRGRDCNTTAPMTARPAPPSAGSWWLDLERPAFYAAVKQRTAQLAVTYGSERVTLIAKSEVLSSRGTKKKEDRVRL